jgi:diguanylate cyclase (GGDEF)-like protein
MAKVSKNRRRHRTRHITTRLLVHISAWSLLAMALLSLAVFQYTYQRGKAEIIAALEEQQEQAVRTAERYFSRIESHARILHDRFLANYETRADDPTLEARFERWYVETEPGVLRLGQRFFEGVEIDHHPVAGLSAFIGRRQRPLDSELTRRIVIAQQVLGELGPAWADDVSNTHLSLPENVLLMYARDNPWGLLADADLDITRGSTIRSTLPEQNPAREGAWTGLYYDQSAGLWTITYQLPIDRKGRHLANASFDVALSGVLSRLVEPGGQNATTRLVVNRAGRVVATSRPLMPALHEKGFVSLEDVPDSALSGGARRALEALLASPDEASSLVLEDTDQVVLARPLPRFGGWYLSSYPATALRSDALARPLEITAASMLLLALVMTIVYWLVRQQVSRPLASIAEAASMLTGANYHELLGRATRETDARGEVGLVLRSFRTAAERLYGQQEELEREVVARTRELAEANRQLDRLAHTDGLTGLLNRRSFDRDLRETIAAAGTEPCWLGIGDLDGFKAYNDHYGHDAGDRALRSVAETLREHCDGEVYRYGGEEMAVLLRGSDAEVRDHFASLARAIETLGIAHEARSGSPPLLTISIGAVRLRPDEAGEAAIRRADACLYARKRAGGNGSQVDSTA